MRKPIAWILPAALLVAGWMPAQAQQGQQPARAGESIAGKAAAAKAATDKDAATERKRAQTTAGATAPAALAPAAAAKPSTSTATAPSGPEAVKAGKSHCHSSGGSDV